MEQEKAGNHMSCEAHVSSSGSQELGISEMDPFTGFNLPVAGGVHSTVQRQIGELGWAPQARAERRATTFFLHVTARRRCHAVFLRPCLCLPHASSAQLPLGTWDFFDIPDNVFAFTCSTSFNLITLNALFQHCQHSPVQLHLSK